MPPETLDQVDALQAAMESLDASAQRFGASITGAFARAVVSGRSFEDVLRSIGLRLVDLALNSALQPLQALVGGLFSSLTKGLAGGLGKITAFADGGVVASPTYFPLAGGTGLMGEAGAEAILPLARGADGKLGVRGGGQGTIVNVTIAAQDVESFRRSEAQIAGTLARAVSRGRRAI